MMPNSFLISFGETAVKSRDSAYSNCDTSLYLLAANPKYINTKIDDRGFTIFIGESLKDRSYDPTNNNQSARAGTLITYDNNSQKISIICDKLGTSIVYWKNHNGVFLLSNRKENLLGYEDSADWASIQQYLHMGYTIGSSTFFKSIYQTEANVLLEVSRASDPKILISKHTEKHLDQPVSVMHLTDQVADRLSQILSSAPPSVIMMSAGWDSRTLLLNGKSNISGAYTHGDLSSREIRLTHQLTSGQRLDHLFVDVESCKITNTLIDTMLDELGFGIFPIWYIAVQRIRSWKNAPIMSGVLGELLGGHYGLMSWGSRKQKLLSSALLLSDALISESQIRKSIRRYCSPPQSHWFISDFGQEILDQHRLETRDRAQDAIENSFRDTGSWQRALEDFNMAHRARQYILKQAQTASGSIGYTIPFADECLSDLVRSLDFKYRIHNKTNQRILQKRKPSLLKEPMAATLVSAKYPILFQEFSRFYRILKENSALALGREKPRLGWFNYDHIYGNSLLHDLTDTLKSDLWDKGKMHNTLNSNPRNHIDAGSTLDMICKLKTVDHQLSALKTARTVSV
ncbi:MAG: hypothetical protein ACTHZ7_14770 [Sphingobacterium sp.]